MQEENFGFDPQISKILIVNLSPSFSMSTKLPTCFALKPANLSQRIVLFLATRYHQIVSAAFFNKKDHFTEDALEIELYIHPTNDIVMEL
jgi:hypothetical protein